MTTNDDIITQLKSQFYKDAFSMADKAFNRSVIEKDNFLKTVKSYYNYLDEFLKQFENFTSSKEETIDCKKGCSTCCYQAVFMSPFEAIYLAENIKKHTTFHEFYDLLNKVKLKRDSTAKMSAKNYLSYRHSCPLLNSQTGACTFHEFRAIACRIYLSRSVSSCIRQHNNPMNNDIFANLFELPLNVGRSYCKGFNDYFNSRNISSQEVKFEHALYIALNTEDCFEKWIDGSLLFETNYSEEDIQEFQKYLFEK